MAICSSASLREHSPALERNLFKRTVSFFFTEGVEVLGFEEL